MTKLIIKAHKDRELIYSGYSTPSGKIVHETPDILLGMGWPLHEMIAEVVLNRIKRGTYESYDNAAHAAAVLGVETVRRLLRPYRKSYSTMHMFGIGLELDFDDTPNEAEDALAPSLLGGSAPTIWEQKEKYEKWLRGDDLTEDLGEE